MKGFPTFTVFTLCMYHFVSCQDRGMSAESLHVVLLCPFRFYYYQYYHHYYYYCWCLLCVLMSCCLLSLFNLTFSDPLQSLNKVCRVPNLLSFNGVPSPPFRLFRGYLHPLLINLEGITPCSELPALYRTLVFKTKMKVVFGF